MAKATMQLQLEPVVFSPKCEPALTYCNICGKELDLIDQYEDFSIHRDLGYGTIYDGGYLNLNICCDCMAEIIESCVISPVEE